MDTTGIIVLTAVLAIGFIFPIWGAYVAFQKGRTGWAVLILITTFIGMGWLLAAIAFMVPPSSRELGVKCPHCGGSQGYSRVVLLDRTGNKEVTPVHWSLLALAGGIALSALGLWLIIGILTLPEWVFSRGATMNCVPTLFPLVLGGVLISTAVKEIVRWRKADRVQATKHKCAACKNEWHQSGTIRTLKEVVEKTSPPQTQEVSSVPFQELTQEEKQVLHLLAESLPNLAIAERLGISPVHASLTTSELLRKFGVESKDELVSQARRKGYLPPS